MSATDCPSCGEDQELRAWGLDVLSGDDLRLDWVPCCSGVAERVRWYGWDAVWGEPLAVTVGREVLGATVEAVTEDSRVILGGEG